MSLQSWHASLVLRIYHGDYGVSISALQISSFNIYFDSRFPRIRSLERASRYDSGTTFMQDEISIPDFPEEGLVYGGGKRE